MDVPRRSELTDLYELLEISPRASPEVIQAAYRVLARNYHPDVNASADAALRIRQLNAAYSVLSQPQDRARYDLECSRARRNERLTQANDGKVTTTWSGRRQSRVLPLRPAIARHPLEDRLPVLGGQAVMAVLVVAAMVAFLLVVVWATFGTVGDDTSVYQGPKVEWSGR